MLNPKIGVIKLLVYSCIEFFNLCCSLGIMHIIYSNMLHSFLCNHFDLFCQYPITHITSNLMVNAKPLDQSPIFIIKVGMEHWMVPNQVLGIKTTVFRYVLCLTSNMLHHSPASQLIPRQEISDLGLMNQVKVP